MGQKVKENIPENLKKRWNLHETNKIFESSNLINA
jgi:hypothetical protein